MYEEEVVVCEKSTSADRKLSLRRWYKQCYVEYVAEMTLSTGWTTKWWHNGLQFVTTEVKWSKHDDVE